MSNEQFPRPTNQRPQRPPVAAGDPLLDPRLARFAERSAAHRAAGATPTGPTGRPAPVRSSGARVKRHHAAQGSRALALGLSVGTTLGLAGWMYTTTQVNATSSTTEAGTTAAASTTAAAGAATASTASTTASNTAGTTAADATTATTAADTTAASTTAASTTGLADGTYTGDTFTNKWGDVQVEITVEGGVITDVAALQVPDGDHKSVEINDQAVPYLEQEALTAQSADIDTVSGATYTSEGYRQSLQTAIDDARAAVTAS